MYNYEKKYWSKNEFTLNGKAYEGYVGIRKNNGYVFDTNEPLVKNNSFSARFNSSKNFFDRILNEEMGLPHSKKEIQYQNNDFLHQNTLKTIIKNLSENNDYIFKCCTISNTSLPATENVLLYKPISETEFERSILGGSSADAPDSNLIKELDNITASDMCALFDPKAPDGEVTLLIFLGINGKIKIIKHKYYPHDINKDDSDLDLNLSLTIDKVDISKGNSISYLNIKDLKIKDNYLYVVDDKLHMVVRYDIEFLRNTLELDIKNIRLLDVLQGEGTVESKVYFKSPCAIDADDDFIYVADAGNGCIKKYTHSFDFVKTLYNISLEDQKFQAIAVNPFSFTLDDGTRIPKSSMWVLTATTNFFYIYVIYDNFMIFSRRIEKINLIKGENYEGLEDEEFKSIRFSFTNSNYYYICTSRRIFKFHLTKPFFPFASLTYKKQRLNELSDIQSWAETDAKWNDFIKEKNDFITETMDNKLFCICGYDRKRRQFDGDIILHIGTLLKVSLVHNDTDADGEVDEDEIIRKVTPIKSGIFLYTEPASFVSSMGSLSFPIYMVEEMESIHHDEYINPQTFNKIVYKLAHNLITLKNQIIGRFCGAYNTDGIMVFDQLIYDDFFKNFTIEDIDGLFVHENEPISIMINRIFEKIYDIQEKLLEHLTAKFRAISAFTNNSTKII